MDLAHSHSNSSCYRSTTPTIASRSTTLAIPRDNLATIFDSHNNPQSRRWGTSYVRRWGTRPSSLTSNAPWSTGWGTSPGQGTLSVYPSDYYRLYGPLPIPTCFLSFIYLMPAILTSRSILGLNQPQCPAPLTSVDTWSRSWSQGSHVFAYAAS